MTQYLSYKELRDSMHGYSVTSSKPYATTDGYAYHGKVKKGSKKVCDFEERGDGGPMRVYFADKLAEADFMALAKALHPEYNYEQESALIAHLCDTNDMLKAVERAAKKAALVVLTDCGEGEYITLKCVFNATNAQRIRDHYGARLVRIINEEMTEVA